MSSLLRAQYRSDSIVEFYLAHGCDKAFTLKHFREQGVCHMTIRRAIDRYIKTGTSQFKPITGRPVTAATLQTVKKINKRLEKKPNTSLTQLADLYNISARTVDRIKKSLGYKSYKVKMVKYNAKKVVKGAPKTCENSVPSSGAKS